MPGANPVTFEPGNTHDTHRRSQGAAAGRKKRSPIARSRYTTRMVRYMGMGGDMDNARRITCAIAIHNAQSVSRTETETSLGN